MSTITLIAPMRGVLGACIAAIAALRAARHTAHTNARIAAAEQRFKVVDGLLEAAAEVKLGRSSSLSQPAPFAP